AERLQREFDAVGFYMSAHPLDEYGNLLDRLGGVGSGELEQSIERQGGAANVVLAGSVIALQQRTSQRGSKYAFVQLSDALGTFEVTIFAEVLAASRDILESGNPVLVQTAARIEGGQLRLTGQSVRELESAAASAPVAIRVWLDGAEPIGSLSTLIDRDARPKEGRRANGRIRLIIPDGEQDVIVRLDGGYLCTPELNRAIRAIPGVIDVKEI
ncbi:MAG TPA: DNA polymerase III subunit alpha, partial [Rhodospirillaceae bacterium]|nr:DNA polymerase III subunit alpha [Rhodospirillaceae bacterium]